MKGIFKAKFTGYKKLGKSNGKGLSLSNIRTEGNIPFAQIGTVSSSKGFKELENLELGDVVEFEAEVKEVAFEYPKDVRMLEKKLDHNDKEPLEAFFDLNKE
jgi:hypothetical protein